MSSRLSSGSRLQPRRSKGAFASPLSSMRSRRKRRPADLPAYLPVDANDRTASLTVRDRSGQRRHACRARSGDSTVRTHACASRSTKDSSRDGSTRSTTPPPARKWPAPGWLLSVMRRRHSAIAPTCRCAADRRISSALRRADGSCVSSCTTASTPTKRIAARSISCGRTSPARDGIVQRAIRNAGLQHVLSHTVPISRISNRPAPDGSRDGILAAYRSESDAEGDLHEHVG